MSHRRNDNSILRLFTPASKSTGPVCHGLTVDLLGLVVDHERVRGVEEAGGGAPPCQENRLAFLGYISHWRREVAQIRQIFKETLEKRTSSLCVSVCRALKHEKFRQQAHGHTDRRWGDVTHDNSHHHVCRPRWTLDPAPLQSRDGPLRIVF